MAKGLKTGGRSKGTPNKVTSDVRALAQQYTDVSLKALARIVEKGERETAIVSAANALLDRAHGKPRQALEHTGAGGGPIQHYDLSKLTDDELDARGAMMQRLEQLQGSVQQDEGSPH